MLEGRSHVDSAIGEIKKEEEEESNKLHWARTSRVRSNSVGSGLNPISVASCDLTSGKTVPLRPEFVEQMTAGSRRRRLEAPCHSRFRRAASTAGAQTSVVSILIAVFSGRSSTHYLLPSPAGPWLQVGGEQTEEAGAANCNIN